MVISESYTFSQFHVLTWYRSPLAWPYPFTKTNQYFLDVIKSHNIYKNSFMPSSKQTTSWSDILNILLVPNKTSDPPKSRVKPPMFPVKQKDFGQHKPHCHSWQRRSHHFLHLTIWRYPAYESFERSFRKYPVVFVKHLDALYFTDQLAKRVISTFALIINRSVPSHLKNTIFFMWCSLL